MDYDRLSKFFESTLLEFCKAKPEMNLKKISKSRDLREEFASRVVAKIKTQYKIELSSFYEYAEPEAGVDDTMKQLGGEDVEQALNKKKQRTRPTLEKLVEKSIDAFFDNDLFMTTRLFMKSAVGSFGLMVTSSLDAHRQICIAARGQPMSIAF